jgi:hypothetical protein
MTTIIIDRAVVEQALEALTVLLNHLDGVPADKLKLADWIKAESDLYAALAQHSPAPLIDPRGSLGEPIV